MQLELSNNQTMNEQASLSSFGALTSITAQIREIDKRIKKYDKDKPFFDFDLRCKIFSYLDLITIINKISKLSSEEYYGLPKANLLDQSRVLLIMIGDGHSHCVHPIHNNYFQFKYCIQLATKLDIRIQEFCDQDAFILSAI